MNLSEQEKEVIISLVSKNYAGKLRVLIYGSRSRNSSTLESDIDILIFAENLLSTERLRTIKIEISDTLGGTKIDIVQSTFENKSSFVSLIEDNAVLLWERG